MFKNPFWETADGQFWINIIAGMFTSSLAFILGYLARGIWTFSFGKRRFNIMFGNDSMREKGTYIVADILHSIFPPTQTRFYKRFPSKTIEINGPNDCVGDCIPRATSYLSTFFRIYTDVYPLVDFDEQLAEKREANFICLGSSASNLKTNQILSHESNKFVKFGNTNTGLSFIEWQPTGEQFRFENQHDVAMLAKFQNPDFPNCWIIVCAGLGVWGTSGSAFYLSRYWQALYRRYRSKPFAILLQVTPLSDESVTEIRHT